MIRTALIGYGKVAHLHAEALQQSALAECVAVWGRAEKASTFAQQYNIVPYTDLKDMLSTEEIQAVIVCTPHPAHADSAVTAAEKGVHVLVENSHQPR